MIIYYIFDKKLIMITKEYNSDFIVSVEFCYPTKERHFKYIKEKKNFFGKIKPEHFKYNFHEYQKASYTRGEIINKGYLIINNEVYSRYRVFVKFVDKSYYSKWFSDENEAKIFFSKIKQKIKLSPQ